MSSNMLHFKSRMLLEELSFKLGESRSEIAGRLSKSPQALTNMVKRGTAIEPLMLLARSENIYLETENIGEDEALNSDLPTWVHRDLVNVAAEIYAIDPEYIRGEVIPRLKDHLDAVMDEKEVIRRSS